MVQYWTQDEANPAHAAILAFDLIILALTLLALHSLDLKNRFNVLVINGGILSSAINSILTYLLDIQAFGTVSNRLYLVASVFYLITWVIYLFLIWTECKALGTIATSQRKLLLAVLAISAAGLLPAIGFFLYASVVGYTYTAVYYWGIPVVLLNPIFDLTVLVLLSRHLYAARGWAIPLHIRLSVAIMVGLKLWLLIIVATPSLPLYCQFEELAMHVAFGTVVLVFLDIQSKFRTLQASTQLKSQGVGRSGKMLSQARSMHGSTHDLGKSQSTGSPEV